jgi:RNA polymerase sigma-70 factor, ECF subfamily
MDPGTDISAENNPLPRGNTTMGALAFTTSLPNTPISSAMAAAREMRDEASMIASILSGETRIFHELVRPYEEVVYRTAFMMLKNDADAEDVVQETFLKAFRSLASFRYQAKFSTWLMSIGLNEARALLRRRGNHRFVSLDEPADEVTSFSPMMIRDKSESPLELLERNELHVLLEDAIGDLSPIYKEVFKMRAVEEHSVKVTAQAISSTETVVKVRQHRARHLLQKRLGSYKAEGARAMCQREC